MPAHALTRGVVLLGRFEVFDEAEEEVQRLVPNPIKESSTASAAGGFLDLCKYMVSYAVSQEHIHELCSQWYCVFTFKNFVQFAHALAVRFECPRSLACTLFSVSMLSKLNNSCVY